MKWLNSFLSGFKRRFSKHRRAILICLAMFVAFLLIPPVRFNDPCSTVFLDRNGKLLGARVASDGQWRFPVSDSIPEKYRHAVLIFEDRYFYFHPGINPASIFRALRQNLKEGHIVSGGSTLSMQLARLSAKNASRTVWEKLAESFIAIRTELVMSKNSILRLYASNAPFGGNVVGIEAASWRYFGLPPEKLSWAEAATLAVLPNAPSLIFPGKNQNILLTKRNRLLQRMHEAGVFDLETCKLAQAEPVPGKPHRLPDLAPHLLARSASEGLAGKRIQSSISSNFQQIANELVDRYFHLYKANDISNAAALILDTRTGEVLAYIGNSAVKEAESSGNVDVIMAERSYGSLLKPFLYAGMLNEGLLLPRMLVKDVPISMGGYSPANFLKTYSGMVPANRVLSHSLNVPSVILLKQYGIEAFNHCIKELGMTTLYRPAAHYGLSIILGGAEGKLWELTSMYAALGNGLLYPENDSLNVNYSLKPTMKGQSFATHRFSPSVTWFTLKAITETRRPGDQGTFRNFYAPQTVAWKTGTSFGSRDAWAIGVTPAYTVGIWIGNADGEGRPGLTGVNYAAPLMFDLFARLPLSAWFPEPYSDEKEALLCRESGMPAGSDCPNPEKRRIQKANIQVQTCPYHKTIHLDSSEHFRVSDHCYPVSQMHNAMWFILPPVEEWFYSQENRSYRFLPPFMQGCNDESGTSRSIGLIYPYPGARIYLPRLAENQSGSSIWKASHRNRNAIIYWHLDEKLIGTTTGNHQVQVQALPGKHKLTLIDQFGESFSTHIEILGENK